LFLEFHGLSDTSVQEHVDVAAAVCREHGGEEFQFASSEEERNKLWAARHNTYCEELFYEVEARGVRGG
jgi:D-lactate dehydrogenase (cytochrome)